ncbi:MAG TPA: hypothetical protein VF559_11635 [Caulobacteraceae bacterium]
MIWILAAAIVGFAMMFIGCRATAAPLEQEGEAERALRELREDAEVQAIRERLAAEDAWRWRLPG